MAQSRVETTLAKAFRIKDYYANYKPSIFEKQITNRQLQEDETEDVTLECGHTSNYIIPTHPLMQYGFCSQCIDVYLKDQKSEGR